VRGGLEGVAAHLRLAFGRDHSELGRAASRFDGLEFTRNENVQVTGHRRGRSETHFLAASDFFFTLDRHIRDSEPVLRNNRGQLEARAKDRLVPARKKSTGIGRFKLASQHDFPSTGALLPIPHIEKTLPLFVYFTREAKCKRMIAGRKLRR